MRKYKDKDEEDLIKQIESDTELDKELVLRKKISIKDLL